MPTGNMEKEEQDVNMSIRVFFRNRQRRVRGCGLDREQRWMGAHLAWWTGLTW